SRLVGLACPHLHVGRWEPGDSSSANVLRRSTFTWCSNGSLAEDHDVPLSAKRPSCHCHTHVPTLQILTQDQANCGCQLRDCSSNSDNQNRPLTEPQPQAAAPRPRSPLICRR